MYKSKCEDKPAGIGSRTNLNTSKHGEDERHTPLFPHTRTQPPRTHTHTQAQTQTHTHSPVQNKVNVKSSVARRVVVVVAQRRARGSSDKEQKCAKHPRGSHNPLLSCPQGAHQRRLASVTGITCWVSAGWRSADVREQERTAAPRGAQSEQRQ